MNGYRQYPHGCTERVISYGIYSITILQSSLISSIRLWKPTSELSSIDYNKSLFNSILFHSIGYSILFTSILTCLTVPILPMVLLLHCSRESGFTRKTEWFNLLKQCNNSSPISPLKARDPLKALESIPNLNSLLSKEGINPFRSKYFEDDLEHFARIAKYNTSIRQLLLEMISQPDSRVYAEFSDGHPTLGWRMAAFGALQHENVLPTSLWDEYKEQFIQHISNSPWHSYYLWRDLLPEGFGTQSIERSFCIAE